MRRKIALTKQQQVLEECDSPKEYFDAIVKAKQNNEEWAKDIPCDSIVYFAEKGDIEKVRRLDNINRKYLEQK